MKILFISPWYPNRVIPQNGNFVERYAEMVAADHEVEVLHVSEDPELGPGEREVEVRQEPYGRVVRVYYSGAGARVQRLWNRSRAWRSATGALSGAPDLIHAHVLIDGGIVAHWLARKHYYRGFP